MGFDQIVLLRQKLVEKIMKFGIELFDRTLSVDLLNKTSSESIQFTLIRNKYLLTSNLSSLK
jgi:hypothetical protein